jgi:hypothetical protein
MVNVHQIGKFRFFVKRMPSAEKKNERQMKSDSHWNQRSPNDRHSNDSPNQNSLSSKGKKSQWMRKSHFGPYKGPKNPDFGRFSDPNI